MLYYSYLGSNNVVLCQICPILWYIFLLLGPIICIVVVQILMNVQQWSQFVPQMDCVRIQLEVLCVLVIQDLSAMELCAMVMLS